MFGLPDPGNTSHAGLNLRQKLVVVVMNLLLLAELTFSIYLGQQDKENLVTTFLWTFLPMVAVTLVLARVLVRRMGKEEIASSEQ